ncbi:MAG: hypothetical protein PF692_11825 [Kiritimatiellae bacterium]|nr:hypothetical protein [Kiritimatiellia bacterium]
MMTKYGFFSVVCAHDDDGKPHKSLMMIRSRKRSHLEKLKEFYELPEIIENTGTDYRYRIIADRDVTLAMMGKLAEDIDYSNFKNAAHKNCHDDWDYGDFLMSVWSEGLAMQK